ncbi:MAG TPA: hypothetical protein VGU68_15565 [Ktedonobacteraceae bacterium]|nr:hypothetical protein [Ktedonobacteraceae bacterium]
MSKFFPYLIALVALVVGCILVVVSASGGTHTINALGGRTSTPGNIPLFVVGLLLIILSVLGAVALMVVRLMKARV